MEDWPQRHQTETVVVLPKKMTPFAVGTSAVVALEKQRRIACAVQRIVKGSSNAVVECHSVHEVRCDKRLPASGVAAVGRGLGGSL